MDKLIISACICGAEVTKEQNPNVPYTVEEIVREAKSAYDAGASLIHLHVRWDDGTPTQDKGRFQECIDAIRKECPDAIIQPSTGGAVGMTDLERLQSTEVVPTPEMATLDCGMIDLAMKTAYKKGFLPKPIHWDFVLGVQMNATIRDLVYMVESIPEGSTWTATGLGKNAWHIAAATISMGGHVRVGFEDNLYMEKGVLAESNGQMVAKVVELARLLGREVATPDEAREILGLAPRK